MKKQTLLIFSLFLLVININKAVCQGTSCSSAQLVITGSSYTYPAGVNAPQAPPSGNPGPNYGCLGTQPNPAWYYFQISSPGNIEIHMKGSNNNDIDFCCWGPFTSPTSPCLQGLTAGSPTPSHWAPGPSPNYPTLNMVDCSYNSSFEEWCYIPNAPLGAYYILLITNFSNQAQNILFSQTNIGQAGAGSSGGSLLVTTNPTCEGDTLKLYSPTIQNATYTWIGPNNFQSNLQNPIIPNADTTLNGYYNLLIDSLGTFYNGFINVSVMQKPNVSVFVGPYCDGGNTQIIASGAANYIWPQFGGSGPVYYMSPAIQGNFSVVGTLNNGCKDSVTFSVTPQPLPISDFIYTINDNTVLFQPLSIFTSNYYWEFGDGTYSQQTNPIHTYNSIGNYQVSLQSYNFCGVDTVIKPLVISIVGIENSENQKFKISPNPNNGNFTIEIPESIEIQRIEILSMQGKKIKDFNKFETKSKQIALNINNLTKGLYYLKVITEDSIILRKLIIE